MRGKALLQALADLHLHEVAGGDQILGALYGRQVVVLGEIALDGLTPEHAGRWCDGRLGQPVLEFAQAQLAAVEGLRLLGIDVDQDVQLA